MRIAAVMPRPRPVGGAELSLLALLDRLQRQHGHTCRLFGLEQQHRRARVRGVDLETCRDAEELWRRIAAMRPDAMLSTLEASGAAARIAARLGVPHVVWCQSFEHCPPSAAERRSWGVSLERVYPGEADRERLKTADLVVSCSRFLAGRVHRWLGTRPAVLYPEFIPDDVRLSREQRQAGRYITGVCGQAYKGVDIFLALARKFPDRAFRLVGTVGPEHRSEVERLPNVDHRAWMTTRQMLAGSLVVLVPSRWPEPFGRVAVEAMANGIPLLASRTGGLPEAVGGSSALLVTRYRSPEAWAKRLAALLSSPGLREANAAIGRRAARRFLRGDSTRRMHDALTHLVSRRPLADRRPTVAIDGNARFATAFAAINARWHADLDRRGRVRLVQGGAIPADVTIHHDFTQPFGGMPMPAEGACVAVRTWDFGPYPKRWVDVIARQYDELWVHTHWIREQAIRAGVPARRVRVVPLGCDTSLFRPGGPVFRLPTSKRVRFLFVGGAIHRKGIDVLLEAWRAAFTSRDDVCLVVKTNPRDVFYKGIDWLERVREQAADPAGAEILCVDRLLSPDRLAALYRSCQAAVFPYRAEGFGLPILEAMASGCPPVVPRFGACLDFCDAQSAVFVEPRHIQLPVRQRMLINSLGFEEEIDEVDFCEVSVSALARALQAVAALSRQDRTAMQRAAAWHARRFTWERSAAAIEQAVRALRDVTPVRVAHERRRVAGDLRRRAAARALLQRARQLPVRPLP